MKRILVVEDNEKNMYLVTFILKNSGYEVIDAVEDKWHRIHREAYKSGCFYR